MIEDIEKNFPHFVKFIICPYCREKSITVFPCCCKELECKNCGMVDVKLWDVRLINETDNIPKA